MGEVIHIAGQVVTVGTVMRQRCAWCGALLEHRDNSMTSVAVDASASQEVQREEATRALAIKWEGLVAVDGPVRWSVDHPQDGVVPQRSCMATPAGHDG